jgi:hypothetical protein
MLRRRLIAIGDDLSIARRGWRGPTSCALDSRKSEADRTNTSLASAYVFDAISTRELHSRPQNQLATPLSIAKYQSSALAHTNSYCRFLIVRKSRPFTLATVSNNYATALWQENGCQRQLHLGSEQKISATQSGQDSLVKQEFKPWEHVGQGDATSPICEPPAPRCGSARPKWAFRAAVALMWKARKLGYKTAGTLSTPSFKYNIPRFRSQFSSHSDRQSHCAGVFRRPRRRAFFLTPLATSCRSS